MAQGRKYEQLAELCGEVDEGGVVPLRMLRNKSMMMAIGSVVNVIKVYCMKANRGDEHAIEVSDKLDAAGREQVGAPPTLPQGMTLTPSACPLPQFAHTLPSAVAKTFTHPTIARRRTRADALHGSGGAR